MKSQFELDIDNSSNRLASYIIERKLKSALRELRWIRDHSAATAMKDDMLGLLEKNLDMMTAKMNADEIKLQVAKLREEALKAGPTDTDKALLIY